MAKARKRFTATKLKCSWSLQDNTYDEALEVERMLIDKIIKEFDDAIIDELIYGNVKLKVSIKRNIWLDLEDSLKDL